MNSTRRDRTSRVGKTPATVPALPPEAELLDASLRIWSLRNSLLEAVSEKELKGDAWKPADLIVMAIAKADRLPVDLLERIADDESAAPVVVYGPYPTAAWRETALSAGAFLCFSSKTPIEDQHTMLAAAICYGAVLAENQLLRSESEKVSQGLLRAYGGAMERVRTASDEAWGIQSTLEEVQQRILKVLS